MATTTASGPVAAITLRSSFLTLPTELRNQVYSHHFKDLHVYIKQPDGHRNSPCRGLSLLWTCKQILHEAEPMLYNLATFHMQHDGDLGDMSQPYLHEHTGPCRYDTSPGIRNLRLCIGCLALVGYDFIHPGPWAIRKPFDEVEHLHVQVDPSSIGPYDIQYQLLGLWNGKASDAAILKEMSKASHRPFKLSINLKPDTYTCSLLNMVDPGQPSTWMCSGMDSSLQTIEEYLDLRNFLRDWGLPNAEIQSILIRHGIDWCYYAYDEINRATEDDFEMFKETRPYEIENFEELRPELDRLIKAWKLANPGKAQLLWDASHVAMW